MRMKRFADRLAALEAAELERDERAVGWALERLTDAELELLVGFWGRDYAEHGAVAHEGAEAAAVARYAELYEYARLSGLRTENPDYAARSGAAARRLRAACAGE